MNFDLGSGSDRTYNFATLGFLVAAVFSCIITVLILLFGGGGNEALQLPPTLSIPTATETLTPTITRTPLPATFTPTFTPSPSPIPSGTASPTFTTSPTLSPTPTITTTSLPTDTPTQTDTPRATLGTPEASPSPYLFALQADPVFTQNTTNTAGCQWQGIAGQVLDQAGNAFPTQLSISVTGGGLPQALTTTSGSNSLYGAGGYELQLANGVNTQTYFVQLQTTLGTPVSEVVQVSFLGDCTLNLALLTFQQTRPN